jgi:hypothetical protein
MSATNDSHLDVEIISALIDGALATPEADAAQAHLASCAVCQAERAQLEHTVHALRVLPAARPPRSFRIDAAVVSAPTAPATVPAAAPPAPRATGSGRAAWLSPGLLRSLAGVAAGLMVVLFIADAFVPYRAGSSARDLIATGGAALAPVASQVQNQAAARAPAPSDQRADQRAEGAPAAPAVAEGGAPERAAAQFYAPARQAGDSAGATADFVPPTPAATSARQAPASAGGQSGAAAGAAAAVPAAPANAPSAGNSSETLGAGPPPGSVMADPAKSAASQAPPVVVNQVYPRDSLRPLHLGAGFGALAFLLIVASVILARRRAAARLNL